MEAVQYRELLDISLTPNMQLVYYRTLRQKYNGIIFDRKDEKLPEKPPEMYLPADGPEARDAVMSVFRSLKRGMGYGG